MTKEEILAKYNQMSEHTLMRTLEIEYIDVDPEEGMLRARMPVNSRVHQPMGLLHGGANAALAESLGSAASVLFIDPEKSVVLGIELSCNHLRSKRDGFVIGTATIIHKGRSTHLWEIKICDEEGKLLSQCKLTNMIMPLRKTS
jgi:1,4-dihydroxy-2-naphthoyl-CoA hydrolase